MIGKLLYGIMNFIIALVNIALVPIDTLIATVVPDLSNALQYINNLFDYIITIIGYCIDASGLSDFSITLIVAYYSFVFTAGIGIATVKLALKWYDKLKP